MGTSPSSQIGQRLANAIIALFDKEMDTLEAAIQQSHPVLVAWLRKRAHLSHDYSCGTMVRLYNALCYTDDPVLTVVGVSRLIRALRAWHAVVGPSGFNMLYSDVA